MLQPSVGPGYIKCCYCSELCADLNFQDTTSLCDADFCLYFVLNITFDIFLQKAAICIYDICVTLKKHVWCLYCTMYKFLHNVTFTNKTTPQFHVKVVYSNRRGWENGGRGWWIKEKVGSRLVDEGREGSRLVDEEGV